MSDFQTGLIVGAFIGFALGIVAMALMMVAKLDPITDDEIEEEAERVRKYRAYVEGGDR